MFKLFKKTKRHNDLANIILFDCPHPSLQQSTAQCKEPTRVNHVDSSNLPDHQNAAPKETSNEHENQVVPAKQQKTALEYNIINDFLQRIFLVTVNFGKMNFVAKRVQIRILQILLILRFAVKYLQICVPSLSTGQYKTQKASFYTKNIEGYSVKFLNILWLSFRKNARRKVHEKIFWRVATWLAINSIKDLLY